MKDKSIIKDGVVHTERLTYRNREDNDRLYFKKYAYDGMLVDMNLIVNQLGILEEFVDEKFGIKNVGGVWTWKGMTGVQ